MPSSTDDNASARSGDAAAGEALPQPTLDQALSGSKRKEMEAQKKKPSFKAVGHLVLAMKRFSAAINPTYTYGKRTSSIGGSKQVTEEAEAWASSGEKRLDRPPSSGRRSTTPEDKYAYPSHGHRFDLLFKPLPATEDEEAAAGNS